VRRDEKSVKVSTINPFAKDEILRRITPRTKRPSERPNNVDSK
jgi:hypothetical protein